MKNILLTCFGGNIAYEILLDFQKRGDMGLFLSDVNPDCPASSLVGNMIQVLPFDHPDFCTHLLKQAKQKEIGMIIPGGDEEAFALMREKKLFEKEGIVVGVQDPEYLPLFQSKSNMYAHLRSKGMALPRYHRFKTEAQFLEGLALFEYPKRPLLIKPDSGRGGHGVVILSEKYFQNKESFPMLSRALFESCLDGKTEFLMMEYIEGRVYDIDLLRYKNNATFFGIRRRFNNASKAFSGNVFEKNGAILDFARELNRLFPTRYLVDYDLMVDAEGKITLLEINPRPSGSTISYIPFGMNLYYVLAKSYIGDEHIPLDFALIEGKQAVAFHKMVGGDFQ